MSKIDTLRLTGGLLGASAAAGIASFCLTNFLAKAALDRENPPMIQRAGERISGSLLDAKIVRLQDEAEEKLFQEGIEEIRIQSHDGLELVGHWYPVEQPRRVVIAMHGWRSSWSRDFGIISEFLHENDCSVLFAEQRGQNNSGGDYMGFGATEQHDCLAWVRWANQRMGEQLPVYLCGVSMGATTVLMASDLDLPGNVRGIVADCGFTSADDICAHIARDNLRIAYQFCRPIARRVYRDKNRVDAFQYSAEEALKNAKVPILFIHGSSDHFVPVEMTYRNYIACTSPKQLLIVPGAEHAMSYMVDRARYQQAVFRFWDQWDAAAPTAFS